MSEQSPEMGIDTTVPHSARVWNYLLGGKDYYSVDAELGERLFQEHPEAAAVAPASRLFLHRVISYLTQQVGMDQFLDIGTGLPTADNTHEVAQRNLPTARIVYVDNDPLVLAHAHALLVSGPQGSTDYIQADVEDPDTVLAGAAETLDLTRPVGLTLLSMLGHIPDPDAAARLVRRYTSRLASGSYLAVCDSIDSPEMLAQQETYTASGAVPYIVRTREQIAATAEGCELVDPGLVPVTHWRPQSERPTPTHQWGFLARVP